jgi:hypothetical protein
VKASRVAHNVGGLAMWWYLKFVCPLPLLIKNTDDYVTKNVD